MADPTQAVAVYPLTYGDTGVPAQMDMQSATESYHNLTDMKLQYAGKWMVFYARILSGSGSVSSRWTTIGQVYRLPYVKLDAPSLNSGIQDTMVTVNVSATPMCRVLTRHGRQSGQQSTGRVWMVQISMRSILREP